MNPTSPSPARRNRRSCSRLLMLLSLGMLAPAPACVQPVPPDISLVAPENIADRSNLPPQLFCRIYLVGIREATAVAHDTDASSVGVRFSAESRRLIPCNALSTAAGATMPVEEFRSWMNELTRPATAGKENDAALYVSPQFAIQIDRTAGASNFGGRRYVANWTLDRTGRCSAEHAELRNGSSIRITPTAPPAPAETEESAVLLLQVEIKMRNGDLKKWTAADGFDATEPKWAPPLGLELPTEEFNHLHTTALVEMGHAVILAHYIKQYRTPGAGKPATAGAQEVREHLLYAAALTRSGNWPAPAARHEQKETAELPARPVHHTATLFWPIEASNVTEPAPAPSPTCSASRSFRGVRHSLTRPRAMRTSRESPRIRHRTRSVHTASIY